MYIIIYFILFFSINAAVAMEQTTEITVLLADNTIYSCNKTILETSGTIKNMCQDFPDEKIIDLSSVIQLTSKKFNSFYTIMKQYYQLPHDIRGQKITQYIDTMQKNETVQESLSIEEIINTSSYLELDAITECAKELWKKRYVTSSDTFLTLLKKDHHQLLISPIKNQLKKEIIPALPWNDRTLNQPYKRATRGLGIFYKEDIPYLVSTSLPRCVQVWNAKEGTCITQCNDSLYPVDKITLLNQTVVTGGHDTVIQVWNPLTGERITTKNLPDWASALTTITHNNKQLVAIGYHTNIELWDGQDVIHAWHDHPDVVTALAPYEIKNEMLLISGSKNGHICLWDPSNGNQLLKYSADNRMINALLALTQLDQPIILSASDSTIYVWNASAITSGQLDEMKKLNEWDTVSALAAINGDKKKYIVAGTWGLNINIWDPLAGTIIRTIKRTEFDAGSINDVLVFNIDGIETVACASEDGTIKLWSQPNAQALSLDKILILIHAEQKCYSGACATHKNELEDLIKMYNLKLSFIYDAEGNNPCWFCQLAHLR